MAKLNKWFERHVGFAIGLHFFSGLGIAWLISLAWYCSTVALVLGIVFTVAGIAGHIYARVASRKIEV